MTQQLADLAAGRSRGHGLRRLLPNQWLHGELDWQTPAERFDGTPFTDRGFGSVSALANVAGPLDSILAA